jgi:hypothetical protein
MDPAESCRSAKIQEGPLSQFCNFFSLQSYNFFSPHLQHQLWKCRYAVVEQNLFLKSGLLKKNVIAVMQLRNNISLKRCKLEVADR